MNMSKKNRRRNKRAKAVRRLQGVVNALLVQWKAAKAKVEALGGSVESLTVVRDATIEGAASREAELHGRVAVLEKVPGWVRSLFGAR